MRPFVQINVAMSADGKIATASRERPRFASARDLERLMHLRAQADGLLIGAETLRSSDPPTQLTSESARAERLARGAPASLLVITVTRSARLPQTLRFFTEPQDAGRIVATTRRAPAERVAALPPSVETWTLGDESVDLEALLDRLFARGVRRLLCEGGSELNAALLAAGLVDEVYVTLVPVLLTGANAPSPFGGPGFVLAERRRLDLLDWEHHQGELYLRYRVRGGR